MYDVTHIDYICDELRKLVKDCEDIDSLDDTQFFCDFYESPEAMRLKDEIREYEDEISYLKLEFDDNASDVYGLTDSAAKELESKIDLARDKLKQCDLAQNSYSEYGDFENKSELLDIIADKISELLDDLDDTVRSCSGSSYEIEITDGIVDEAEGWRDSISG